jgi:tRNA threonylcarbamoyladenosine biosynthesis protein TsaE
MNKISDWRSVSLDGFGRLAEQVKAKIEAPAIILLEGEMGAGKTSFARSFSKGACKSPTYSIIESHDVLAHADFFRIQDPEEFEYLGIENYLQGCEYFLMEWAKQYWDLLVNYIPERFTVYQLNITNPGNGVLEQRHFELYRL